MKAKSPRTTHQKTNYGSVDAGVDIAEIEKRQDEIESSLSPLELKITEQEKITEFYKLSYTEFMYALKRYTFRGQPFSSTIFEGICPDLNIKWSAIADDNKTDDPYF